jgi:hypothetical protein
VFGLGISILVGIQISLKFESCGNELEMLAGVVCFYIIVAIVYMIFGDSPEPECVPTGYSHL